MHLIKRSETILMRIAALIAGVLAGLLATLIHFSLMPVGLFVALAGSLASSLLVRHYTHSRLAIIIFAVAWIIVVFRGGSRSGEELLVIANTAGYTLLYLGPILVSIPVLLPRPKQSMRDSTEST